MASQPLARATEESRGGVDRRQHPLRRGAFDWHDDDALTPRGKLKFRTVWISDTHLGTAGCNAELLHDFLHSIKPETLYLVGDIIDGWRLKRGWYWPAQHNDIVRRVLKLANKGTRVVYIPGNHDEAARERGVDGVVCGHIHSAEIRDFEGILYMNDGDWVESCTALVEHFDGRIEIINWAHHTAALKVQATAPAIVKTVETLRALEPA